MMIQGAAWITMDGIASTVVPVFRKTFSRMQPVRSAVLEVTCDGVYEAQLNGQRVGSFILAPGWTEYRKRLQVQSYESGKRPGNHRGQRMVPPYQRSLDRHTES